MVCAPVRSIIPSLKLGDYLSVQAHKPCSISHLFNMLLLIIGVGRGGGGAGGGGGGGGGGGQAPPNNLRGGPTYPLAPPIIHPPVPAKLFLSILSLNFL